MEKGLLALLVLLAGTGGTTGRATAALCGCWVVDDGEEALLTPERAALRLLAKLAKGSAVAAAATAEAEAAGIVGAAEAAAAAGIAFSFEERRF